MNKKTIRDIDLKGKRVLVRVDFNVPLSKAPDAGGNYSVTDDTRIRAALPTINYLIEQGAKLILCSHLGRPKAGPEPKSSLAPAAKRLGELLGNPVALAPDCVGPEVEKMALALQPGEVLLLENVRFHAEEEKNDPAFAKQLAAEIEQVNDTCQVLLGTTKLSLQRILELEPGDVIPLSTSEGASLPVFIQGRGKFTGQPKVSGGGIALELDRGPLAELKRPFEMAAIKVSKDAA